MRSDARPKPEHVAQAALAVQAERERVGLGALEVTDGAAARHAPGSPKWSAAAERQRVAVRVRAR